MKSPVYQLWYHELYESKNKLMKANTQMTFTDTCMLISTQSAFCLEGPKRSVKFL